MQPPKLKPALELPLPALLPSRASALQSAQRDVLALYDEHAPPLLRYARSFGLTGEAAEDVVQDVFVALFRHLVLDRPRHNLTGWLFRVTRNLSLKQRRRSGASTPDLFADLLIERLVDPADTPEERMAFEQRARRLRSVVRALTPRDRQCVYLRSEGLSYREIAGALGMSLGGVAKSLARALARLSIEDRR
jgi:RNA polymerase sigma-70 factor (ECF subfamily)